MTDLINQLRENNITVRANEPMKLHTTFKTGGPAEVFIEIENKSQLITALKLCNKLGKEYFILGNGSNLLVSDEGIRNKAVIHLSGSFSDIRLIDETTIEVSSGASLASLCKFAMNNSLTGLEFAYGIPGSCGGAVYMNAGAYGGEMKDVVTSVSHINEKGEESSFSGDDLDFSYRHSVYSGSALVISSVTVTLEKGDKKVIEDKMIEIFGRRKDKQPLEYPSAGSVFKRPEGYFAGALIEQSGLKGKKIGGAMVSEKHAGFIINYDKATTSDVVKLIEHCRETVFDKFGVRLETEIKRV